MPTLTPHSTMDPQPRVDIVFDSGELDVAVDTITVIASYDGGQYNVRDGVGQSAVGGFAVTDYEAPSGVTVTYQAQQYDVSGAVLGLTDSDTTTISIASGYAVVSDPLAPNNAVLVRCEAQFSSRLVRSRPQQLYRVGFETIALQGELGLLGSVPLRVFTESLADATALEDVLEVGVALVRTSAPMPLPRQFYGAFAEVPRDPFDAPFGGEWNDWDLVGDQVTRPSIATLVPAVTYQTYVSFYTGQTYGDTLTEYTTYLDSIVNPPAEA